MAEQFETAVYTNMRGEIVIRQRDVFGEDVFIYVQRGNADRLAMAIEKEAERPFERSDHDNADGGIEPEQLALPAPEPEQVS